jgi:hypothetical protein
LNCSKFKVQEGAPLSWICSQHLNYTAINRESDLNRRLRTGFKALMHCLLETGFNYSSEQHEGASWFSESRDVDSRISSVEQWQEASQYDPLFVLDVPWLPVGLNVEQVARRIHENLGAAKPRPVTAKTLAQWIFNYQPESSPSNGVRLLNRFLH